LQQQVLSGLHSFNADVQRAAVRIALEHFLRSPRPQTVAKTEFANMNTAALGIFLEEVSNPPVSEKSALVSPAARLSQDQGLSQRSSQTQKSKSRSSIPSWSIRCWASLLNSDR